RDLLHFARGPDRHRELAAPLQHDQAARLAWIQATSTRGFRACLRRVAGCATPSGSAGHAGETANLKLTFHPDHSAGADQVMREVYPVRVIAAEDFSHDLVCIPLPVFVGVAVVDVLSGLNRRAYNSCLSAEVSH